MTFIFGIRLNHQLDQRTRQHNARGRAATTRVPDPPAGDDGDHPRDVEGWVGGLRMPVVVVRLPACPAPQAGSLHHKDTRMKTALWPQLRTDGAGSSCRTRTFRFPKNPRNDSRRGYDDDNGSSSQRSFSIRTLEKLASAEDNRPARRTNPRRRAGQGSGMGAESLPVIVDGWLVPRSGRHFESDLHN
jgi:hypothetical protein